ncbi:MAG: hypothetical protein HGB02_03880 [Chlorobiaceae bacterium]|nr:hypothetical protein [Chlorobiaceae bacterium]
MNDLVFIKDNERALTTSLLIAERFGRKHDIVLRAIRNMECSDDFNARNFAAVEYTDKKGESRPMYQITRDGFSFLVMGFTGKEAAKFKEEFIAAFNAMEAELNNPERTKLRAFQLLLGDVKRLEAEIEQKDEVIELQAVELKAQAPKVQYCNEVLQATNTHTTTTIAKELGMSAQKLNAILRELGVQYYHDGHWVLYAKHQDKGYTKTRTTTFEGSNGETRTSITTTWTESGRQAVHRAVRRYNEQHASASNLKRVV